jgi:hypothetical protein
MLHVHGTRQLLFFGDPLDLRYQPATRYTHRTSKLPSKPGSLETSDPMTVVMTVLRPSQFYQKGGHIIIYFAYPFSIICALLHLVYIISSTINGCY